jgi:RNA polymerase sigma-70 factor (ECF subfamily)
MTVAAAALAAGPPERTEDAEVALAARAAAGDRAAFTAIYQRFVDAVYARLTRLLGPTPDREDVLQLVFLQVHRALGAYRGEASLATFVHRIAVHVAFDHLRARERRPVPVDQAAIEAMVADAPSPALRAQRREELLQIFHHLSALTPDKRIAFVLVAIDGLSLREAAELVGASPDAVKQRVLHARRALVELIARAERPRRTP